jgi:hypothetical protein
MCNECGALPLTLDHTDGVISPQIRALLAGADSMRRTRTALLALATLFGVAAAAAAQDLNVPRPVADIERELATEPFGIVATEISRPKAKGDITLKADVSFAGQAPYRVKLRRAEPGAEDFNNRPRYELAAYELQKLFLEPAEHVVPPTALRFVPVADLRPHAAAALPTFRGSDEVLVVLQYWLQEVKLAADLYDAARFAADAGYARHLGQLNVLTWLIEHGDSNLGNFLISTAEQAPRVFSVDHGVAFAHNKSDRPATWRILRVPSLPADTVDRLRKVTEAELHERLGVLAQWHLEDGRWVRDQPGANLGRHHGVRRDGDVVQLGLTGGEIVRVASRLEQLLERIDDGEIGLLEGTQP